MNLKSRTKFEQHKDNQDQFKTLMPILARLDSEETEILIHLVKSKGRQLNQSKQLSNDLVDSACSDALKQKLAKISEE
jgi:hypothetical protein